MKVLDNRDELNQHRILTEMGWLHPISPLCRNYTIPAIGDDVMIMSDITGTKHFYVIQNQVELIEKPKTIGSPKMAPPNWTEKELKEAKPVPIPEVKSLQAMVQEKVLEVMKEKRYLRSVFEIAVDIPYPFEYVQEALHYLVDKNQVLISKQRYYVPGTLTDVSDDWEIIDSSLKAEENGDGSPSAEEFHGRFGSYGIKYVDLKRKDNKFSSWVNDHATIVFIMPEWDFIGMLDFAGDVTGFGVQEYQIKRIGKHIVLRFWWD